MNSKQERDLVKRLKNGEREALGQLWDLVTPKLYGYLVNTFKDKVLAEDALQNTWLKAILALPKFKLTSSGFSPWLFAIAKNECRQVWRKAKYQEIATDNIIEPGVDHTKTLNNEILVDQIINKLSEEDQELLRLRYIADLPLNDIAAILNINFVAVRVRMHRAVKRAQGIIN